MERSGYDGIYAVDRATMDTISLGLFRLRFYVAILEEDYPDPEWWAASESFLRSACAVHNRKVLDRQEEVDLTRGSSEED
jgi:hypothetical protein